MHKEDYIELLDSGREHWNSWISRRFPITGRIIADNFDYEQQAVVEHEKRNPDFSGLDFQNRDLSDYKFIYCNFANANLSGCNLQSSNFFKAKLNGAKLENANLKHARFYKADLSDSICTSSNFENAVLKYSVFINATLDNSNFSFADLEGANLSSSSCYKTKFNNAKLEQVRLLYAQLLRTDFSNANLNGCSVYGTSVWDLTLDGARQRDLLITPKMHPRITIDNLEIAQFVYLVIQNKKIRDIIDTLSTKLVLILGRFTKERKPILDSIRDELRNHNYLPVLFDFEGPYTRDLTETVSTLAHLSRFIIADISEPRGIPQELQSIIPNLVSVPIRPLIHQSSQEYGMFEHFKNYNWVIPVYKYSDKTELISNVEEIIIKPAEEKLKSILQKRKGIT